MCMWLLAVVDLLINVCLSVTTNGSATLWYHTRETLVHSVMSPGEQSCLTVKCAMAIHLNFKFLF